MGHYDICSDCYCVAEAKKTGRLPATRGHQGAPPPADPQVRNPSHYQVFDGLESIAVIARSMTVSEFRGFCMGNVLKYRLRAGKKSDQANVTKDLGKADFYKELYTKYKGYCHDAE